jgi:hypothetical protein
LGLHRALDWSNGVTRFRRILLVLLAAVLASGTISLLVARRVLAPAAQREDAFAAIAKGQLTPSDSSGTVPLPPQWKRGSVDGNAYVTGDREGVMWVLFVTDKGSGGRLRGDLFCTKPAAARVSGALMVNYPHPGGSQVEVTVKRILNASCFEVVNQQK